MQFSRRATSASAFWRSWLAIALYLLISMPLSSAIALDVNDKESIKRAAAITAKGLVSFYTGEEPGQIPGILPSPEYYWWEGGAMWMSLIDYWWYTGDDQYNDIITRGIQFQRGEGDNFMVYNWSSQTGNDDQAFWGFAAMDAAELKFPNPPKGQPSWLSLAQAVFNTQTTRFTNTCGGGLPWQVYITSPGYDYKNTISNGCFFSLAARLARYTGNDTYAEWGMKAYEWTKQAGLLTPDFAFYDGTSTLNNCTTINYIQFTYNAGVFLHGAATMWNYTQLPIWKERVNRIVDGLYIFFKNGIMYEQYCEARETCNADQRSFKAYLSRWMAVCAQLAPWTSTQLMELLQTSAKAAADQCIGGEDGTMCGLRWVVNGTAGHYDGSLGPGEQMAAMSVISSLMLQFMGHKAPVTHTEGISPPDPGAGLKNTIALGGTDPLPPVTITTAQKAGAWLVTVLLALFFIGGAIWAMWPEKDGHLKFLGGGDYTQASKAALERVDMEQKKGQALSAMASKRESKRNSGSATAKDWGSIKISSPTHLQSPPNALSARTASPA